MQNDFKTYLENEYKKLDNETIETLNKNGYTKDFILDNFNQYTLDLYYLTTINVNDNIMPPKEYNNELESESLRNYNLFSEAFKSLSDEEKKLLYRSGTSLSYLSEAYVEIESINDALIIIYEEINAFLKENTPYYSLNDLDVIDGLLKDKDINYNKSELLQDDKEETIKDFNNFLLGCRKPYTYNDVDTQVIQDTGLSYKYLRFCEEYLKRGNIKATCEYIGISRNTAYLWLEKEEVKNYLKSRKEEIKKDTDNIYQDTYNTCFSELKDIIKGDFGTSNDTRIKAIDVFLKHYENIERLKQPTIPED